MLDLVPAFISFPLFCKDSLTFLLVFPFASMFCGGNFPLVSFCHSVDVTCRIWGLMRFTSGLFLDFQCQEHGLLLTLSGSSPFEVMLNLSSMRQRGYVFRNGSINIYKNTV